MFVIICTTGPYGMSTYRAVLMRVTFYIRPDEEGNGKLLILMLLSKTGA